MSFKKRQSFLAFQDINLNSEMRGDIQQMSPDEKLYVNEIFNY